MKTLYYKVEVRQHLTNYDRVYHQTIKVDDNTIFRFGETEKEYVIDRAIDEMRSAYGQGPFTAEILEIIET